MGKLKLVIFAVIGGCVNFSANAGCPNPIPKSLSKKQNKECISELLKSRTEISNIKKQNIEESILSEYKTTRGRDERGWVIIDERCKEGIPISVSCWGNDKKAALHTSYVDGKTVRCAWHSAESDFSGTAQAICLRAKIK